MYEWRLVEFRDADGMPYYMLKAVLDVQRPGVRPFMNFGEDGPLTGSRQDIDRTLERMRAALENPVLVYRPACLIEKDTTTAP